MSKVTVTSHINVNELMSKLDDSQFWTFAASEWHRLYTPWVPFDQGYLTKLVEITPKTIEHTTPYARRIYEGEGMNFQKTQHPLASAYWDIAAMPTQETKLIDALQSYVDSGKLKL